MQKGSLFKIYSGYTEIQQHESLNNNGDRMVVDNNSERSLHVWADMKGNLEYYFMNYKSNQVLKRINRLQAYKELQNNTIIQFIN